jgi:HAD superfamily hydrolase (TIGR01549 family)
MKKALLFDFGGTLDTDGIHWSEKFYEVYNEFHIPVSKDNFREAFVYSEQTIANIIKPDFNLKQTMKTQIKYQLEYLLNKFNLTESFTMILDQMTEYCYRSVNQNVKTSREVLDKLSSKYLLGVVSNFYGNVDTVLEELSLKKYFTSIVDSAVVGIRKPEPGIFELALNELSVKPNEAVMIGDSYDNDIKPAKSLGCYTIWIVGKGWNNPADAKDADSMIKSITEIPDTLNKIV